MIAYNVTLGTLGRAADTAGVDLKNLRRQGNGFAFTLALTGERWRRRGHDGRRIASVCWHGHRTFMEAMFNLAPNARLKSMVVTYEGRTDFWANHDATGNRNVGSMMQPLAYRDACDCPLEVA